MHPKKLGKSGLGKNNPFAGPMGIFLQVFERHRVCWMLVHHRIMIRGKSNRRNPVSQSFDFDTSAELSSS